MLREHRFLAWCALAWFVVLEALLAGAVLFWPNFQENLGPLRALLPIEALRGAFDSMAQGGVAGYVYGQHFFKGCNTVGTLAAVVFAMGAVAGEAHRGTLELVLSRALSRRRILLERWIAGALAVVAPVFATTATIPWLLDRVHEEMPWSSLMLSAAHQSLFLAAVYSVTFLLSCFGSRPLSIGFGMLLFTIFEFSLYMIMKVTHASIFRLTDIDVYLGIGATHALDLRIVVPLLVVIAVTLGLSLLAFARRVP